MLLPEDVQDQQQEITCVRQEMELVVQALTLLNKVWTRHVAEKLHQIGEEQALLATSNAAAQQDLAAQHQAIAQLHMQEAGRRMTQLQRGPQHNGGDADAQQQEESVKAQLAVMTQHLDWTSKCHADHNVGVQQRLATLRQELAELQVDTDVQHQQEQRLELLSGGQSQGLAVGR